MLNEIFKGVILLTDYHAEELKKLKRTHKILDKIIGILFCLAIFMFVLIMFEGIGIIDIPFYEQRLPISARVFLNTWIGIPIVIIEKKLKKIDERINEIYSMQTKKNTRVKKSGDG